MCRRRQQSVRHLSFGSEDVYSSLTRRKGRQERWPKAGLAELGLQLAFTEAVVTDAGPVSISGILSTESCRPRYPRHVGIPFKRPLF